MEDFVIIDIQVVHDSVTSLILRAMSFGNVGQATAEKFRKTGQFVLKDLISATAGVSNDPIPPLKLVALLEYLHIVERIYALTISSPENEDVYNALRSSQCKQRQTGCLLQEHTSS